jgi:hypothetical protein
MTQISLWMFTDDWKWLTARHPNNASEILRHILTQYRATVEQPAWRTARKWTKADLENL